jgi:aspartate aminotransferase
MMQVSEMAENLIGSEIIKLAGEINDMIAKGKKIYNFTIGDFDPNIFPIPLELEQLIIDAYKYKQTNYPAANGIAELRKAICYFMQKHLQLDYHPNEILVTSGARPAIYAAYVTLLNRGDRVIYPVPSWNNNHYCHLVGAIGLPVDTKPENNFMPTAEEVKPYIGDAAMIALCSPLNPTGTSFNRESLDAICRLVLHENRKRKEQNHKPLYILYDQIYWVLTYGDTVHYNPVQLYPELRDYTVFIDGLSKSFAATGVRVGWTFGHSSIIDKMKAILSHIGAWSPKAEQVAAAKYLMMDQQVDVYLHQFKQSIQTRLDGFYKGLMQLKQEGYAVDALEPQSAIYLTIQFNLINKKKSNGERLTNNAMVTEYLLHEAGLAIVPFYAFGSDKEFNWYRLSVGTSSIQDISDSIAALRLALSKLSD